MATTALTVAGDFSAPAAVWQAFLELVNRVPGLTILATAKHDFPGGGLTGLVVIGESHAAIHTWPELGRAWLELASCGPRESLLAFESEVQRLWSKEEV